jgi:holo-[acyl-carrier protein] synthase
MIVGLGLDLVYISRIEEAMGNPRFIFRVLTDAEREMCRTPQCVAGRWAAKEAIAKAIGLPLTWQQVEVLPDETGAPHVKITSPNFDPVRLRIHVSITHERDHAAAVAVLERIVMQRPST